VITRYATWPDGTQSSADYSDDERHRYSLRRALARDTPPTKSGTVAFIMLNPSTATETESDPTVRRCENFAKAWGYMGLEVVNLFSLRSKDPSVLYTDPDAATGGAHNTSTILRAVDLCDIAVCAWGVHGALGLRAKYVLSMINAFGDASKLYALGLTKELHPRHPLYLKRDAQPLNFPF
jgi:hypothetical protein